MTTPPGENRHAATGTKDLITPEQLDYAGGLCRRRGLILEEESMRLFNLSPDRLDKIAASSLINFLKTGEFIPPYYPPPKVKREGKPQNIEEEYRGYLLCVWREHDCEHGRIRGFSSHAMKLRAPGQINPPYCGRIDSRQEFRGEGARARALEHIKGLVDAKAGETEREVA